MAHFQANLTGKQKRFLLQSTDISHERLRLLSLEGIGLTMGDVLHLLMQLANLRVGVAKEDGEIPLGMSGATMELYTILTLHDLGLLTGEEFNQAIIVANANQGLNINDRLENMADVANKRIKLLEPHWEQSRKRQEQAFERWNAEEAIQERQQKAVAANN